NKNKACLVAYLDLATSLNGINIIEVRNSMPSIGKHKNIALSKGFNRMSLIKFDPSYENRMVGLASPIRASGNKASHRLDHGLQKNGVKQKQAQRFFWVGIDTTSKHNFLSGNLKSIQRKCSKEFINGGYKKGEMVIEKLYFFIMQGFLQEGAWAT
ncbi:hypothetical protein ACJX0J_010549, partial [Zea mays]